MSASPVVDRRAALWVRRLFEILRRNKLASIGVLWMVLLLSAVLALPWLGLPSPTQISLAKRFLPPSTEHLLGTDEVGRDVLARLLVGGRVSLAVGFSGAVLTVLVASVIGVLAGYLGGAVDTWLMRLTDALMAVPTFFFLLIIVSFWGSSITVMVLALVFTRWMDVARLIRAEVLRFKNQEFVSAAAALGASHGRLMLRHLFPQAVPSLIVATSLNVGYVMLLEASLSFLGLGILPPTPSWGNMLTASQLYIWVTPQLTLYPGLMIAMTVLSLNAIGDVARDVLDPRQAD